MIFAHLTASRFFGGPERQMIGLANSLRGKADALFISFAEEGLCRGLLSEAGRAGFDAISLNHDTPRLVRAYRELVTLLNERRVDILCCHEFKSNTLGLLAARTAGIPVVAVSRGWTSENLRVRCYEALDRKVLRGMDAVVCVSLAQANKVVRSGVRPANIRTIHNAICADRFAKPNPEFRGRLQEWFPEPPDCIVGAAGRLSPEKGFNVLVDAATEVVGRLPRTGFVVFGDGPQREALGDQIRSRGLQRSFVLAGFRSDTDHYLPHLDLVALPSFTEGLPNVALEAMAAGRPVVGTAVGGIPEVVIDGATGYLVPPANHAALAERIVRLLVDPEQRQAMGAAGQCRVKRDFGFAAQATRYQELFEGLVTSKPTHRDTTHDRVDLVADSLLHG